jgi:hypothetical protein
MWKTPKTLFWPFFGWSFPKDNVDNGISFLLMLFKESFIPKFSQSFIPEIMGMILIIILTLSWLKSTLNKTRDCYKTNNRNDCIIYDRIPNIWTIFCKSH